MRLGGHGESHRQLDADQEPDDVDIGDEITIGLDDRAATDDDGHEDRVGDDLDKDGNRHGSHVVVDDRYSNPNQHGAAHDDNDDLNQSRACCCGRCGGGRL